MSMPTRTSAFPEKRARPRIDTRNPHAGRSSPPTVQYPIQLSGNLGTGHCAVAASGEQLIVVGFPMADVGDYAEPMAFSSNALADADRPTRPLYF